MKKKSKPKYKAVWTCDFCDKEFDTKKESDKHEKKCEKNPESNEIVYTFKAPKNTTLVFGILIIYFLVYLVVSSYAQTNGLKEKFLTNPFGWFVSEYKEQAVPTPTPTPTPEITPTPTPKPKVQTKNTNTNNSNNGQIECIGPDGKHFNTTMDECKKLADKWGKPVDYMVNCTLSEKCGGGSKRVSDSECASITCCQVGNNWSYYPSLEKCNQAQGEGSKTQSNNSNWEQYTTIGGGMTMKCEKNMDTIKSADTVHMNAANLYLSPDQGCFGSSPDTVKCAALKKDSDDKNQIFRNELKAGNCILISHQ